MPGHGHDLLHPADLCVDPWLRRPVLHLVVLLSFSELRERLLDVLRCFLKLLVGGIVAVALVATTASPSAPGQQRSDKQRASNHSVLHRICSVG